MDWKRKLTSRKFWSAVATFVSMLIVALKGSDQLAVQITALIMAGAAVVAYIVGEGLADAAATNAYLPVEYLDEDDEDEADE